MQTDALSENLGKDSTQLMLRGSFAEHVSPKIDD